jgi:chromosome segregation ATPase
MMTEADLTPLPGEADSAWLQKELEEAHKTVRTLIRQLGKEQQRHAETARAYNKTVGNLSEIARQNTRLERELDAMERERDMWKARAEGVPTPITIGGLTLDLTADEVSAIRKAMARLHHPDVGGNPERMKAWNAALDPLEG